MSIAQDVRYAVRALRRSPGFAALALLTIALGVAGPTIMFAMAKQWILDPLPFSRPDDLVDLRNLDTVTGNAGSVNPADFLDWQREAASFEELAAYRDVEMRLAGHERAEPARGAQVTPNFFALLGIPAASGRVFAAGDVASPRHKVALISDAMWRRHFASDAAIVGRTIRLENEDYTLLGILPETFQFTLLGAVDVWTPLVLTPEETANRRPRSIIGIGRLRAGRTIEEARSELTSLAERLSKTFPETNARRSVRVIKLAEEVRLHHDAGIVVPVLFAMMCCVLLVACVNVTNLMFARTSTRRQEMAVRLALGASRARIIRQWLVEHVTLFVVASAVGAALAVYGTEWITRSIPPENRQYLRNYAVLTIDGTVLAFALMVGALCGVMFGWLPARISARADVNADLRDPSARASASKAGARLRAALVTSEVAFALALLISAGLLIATARNITAVNVGFDSHQLLTFRLALDERHYRSPADIHTFYERLVNQLAQLPGVAAVGAATLVPFGTEGAGVELFIDGQPETAPADTPSAALSMVTADYPAALGLRLRAGRLLTAADRTDAARVAVINETLAVRHFGNRDPIGQRIRLRRGSTDLWQVVGVVATVKNYETIDRDEPQVYVPFAQSPRRHATVIVRARTNPVDLVAGIRAIVETIDPEEPIADMATMEERIGRVTAPYRTLSAFVAFFGAVTLLLAGIGVYGVVSYTFVQRTREIGIRMALGARQTDVAGLVLRHLRTLLIAGVVPGMLLAWLLGQALKTFLFGVTATDWRLYAAMSALLAAVALLAVVVPARRATTIDPIVALRCE